jgi:transposase
VIFLPRSVKVYVGTEPVNLRKSFDGLSNEVREVLRLDPLSGHIFVFINRRKNQVKLLMWTRGGFTIMHKRLERGTFAGLRDAGSASKHVELDVHELSMLLEGIAFAYARTSKRWEPPMHERASVNG